MSDYGARAANALHLQYSPDPTSVRQFRSPSGREVSSPKKGPMSAQVGPRKILLFRRGSDSVKRQVRRWGSQASGGLTMRDLPRSVFSRE